MDTAGDCEALFVAGASDHRGDASSFIRNMRIRLSVGKAAKWSEEEKIWYVVDKCEEDLKDGLANLSGTLVNVDVNEAAGFGGKRAFESFCTHFIAEFTRGVCLIMLRRIWLTPSVRRVD